MPENRLSPALTASTNILARLYLDIPQGMDASLLKKKFNDFNIKVTANQLEDVSSNQYVILIQEKQNQEELLDRIETLKSAMGSQQELWVCTNRPTAKNALHKEGVHKIIEPMGWTPIHLSERIMAEIATYLPPQATHFGNMVGIAPVMQQIYTRVAQAAPLEEPILILGETGSGKGMVAEEIHRCSQRGGDQPFKLNSAEFREEQLESELFGHVKGAFTGAITDRKGLILESGTGSLFLDEIGELPVTSQAKLLSVIEDRRLRPVGGNKFYNFHSRLIFATNIDVTNAIAEGLFREDLYQRLNIFNIALPKMTERRMDIILLAEHFLKQFNQRYNKKLIIPPPLKDALFAYNWPGNAREIYRVIVQAAGYSQDGKTIAAEILLEALKKRESPSANHQLEINPLQMGWAEAQANLKNHYFRRLAATTNTGKEAIATAGISKAQYYAILKELD